MKKTSLARTARLISTPPAGARWDLLVRLLADEKEKLQAYAHGPGTNQPVSKIGPWRDQHDQLPPANEGKTSRQTENR